MYKMIDYALTLTEKQIKQNDASDDEKTYSYTSSRLLSMNSKVIGDFFFPPPPKKEKKTESPIKVQKPPLPLDDVDSDAELSEEEIERNLLFEENLKRFSEEIAKEQEENYVELALNEATTKEEDEEEKSKSLKKKGKFSMNFDPDPVDPISDEFEGFDAGGEGFEEFNNTGAGVKNSESGGGFRQIKDEDLVEDVQKIFNTKIIDKEEQSIEKTIVELANNQKNILREVNKERLEYLFKIIRPGAHVSHTTAGYFNKILLNLLHFYPLEILNFCLKDTIIMECFIQKLYFEKINEIFCKIVNFEKRLYFNEKQLKWIKKSFDDIRIDLYKKMIENLDLKLISPFRVVVGDLLLKSREVIHSEKILKEVLFWDGFFEKIKNFIIFREEKILVTNCCKILKNILSFSSNEIEQEKESEENDEKNSTFDINYISILRENFNFDFFSKIVQKIEKSVDNSQKGYMVNTLGVEEQRIGLEVYEIISLLKAFFDFGDDIIQERVSKSGFVVLMIKFPFKNILHVKVSKVIEKSLDCPLDSKTFKSLYKDDNLINMLYNCSTEEYMYPDCKLNRRLKKKYEQTDDLNEKKKIKSRFLKSGNYGFLRKIGNIIDSYEYEQRYKKNKFVSGEKWVFFKESYLKKVNLLLSEDREDSFRKKKKRASIYLETNDSTTMPDILDSIKKSFDALKEKNSKKKEKIEKKCSIFANSFGESDFGVQFSEGTGDIFGSFKGEEEGIVDNKKVEKEKVVIEGEDVE